METVEPESGYPAVVAVDLDALVHNYQRVKDYAPGSEVLAVVKANAYGAGLPEVASALAGAGASWFGVARSTEALTLRSHLNAIGSDARILTWLVPENGYEDALAANLDISVSSREELASVVSTTRALRAKQGFEDLKAPVHAKVDVGMSRGGAKLSDWAGLVGDLKSAQDDGWISVEGIWSHLPQADDPEGEGRELTLQQIETFKGACVQAEDLGVTPKLRHLGASAGAIWHPEAHFEMVRPGIALYGLSPAPSVATNTELGLRPVFRMTSRIQSVKQLSAGEAVSYGGTWVAKEPHWIGLLPVGYADGISRSLSSKGKFSAVTDSGLVSTPVLGRVCMDQTIIDLGTAEAPAAQVGDAVVLFGDGDAGEPTVEEWAESMSSINYEVITDLPPTLPRRYAHDKAGRALRDPAATQGPQGKETLD